MDFIFSKISGAYEASNTSAMLFYSCLAAFIILCLALWKILLLRVEHSGARQKVVDERLVSRLSHDGRSFRDLLMVYRDAAADIFERQSFQGLDPAALKRISNKLKSQAGLVGVLINTARAGGEISDEEYERFISLGNRLHAVAVAYEKAVESGGGRAEVDYLFLLLEQGPQLSICNMMEIGLMGIHLGNTRTGNHLKPPGGFVADASSELFDEIAFASNLLGRSELFIFRNRVG